MNYFTTYQRNQPIISQKQQNSIKQLKVMVAGCGSTGGAAIEGLSRLGVEKFILLDNGSYEENNLNRQFVTRDDLEKNKAEVQKSKILQINPNAQIHVENQGVTDININNLAKDCDFIFDAVDVTTPDGMQAKLLLHKVCHEQNKATLSALDLGYTQWIRAYNYQSGEELLAGRFKETQLIKHPLKQLIVGFCTVNEMDFEICEEAVRIIENPNEGACQLACACYLLAAFITPYTLYWLENSSFPTLVKYNLLEQFEDDTRRKERNLKNKQSREKLLKLLETLN